MNRETRSRDVRKSDLHEPHSVSLKVLRLTRPSLAQQYPLPLDGNPKIPHVASLAYPSPKQKDQTYILAANLTLPPAFGSAHVGETFSCSLCANNELPEGKNNRSLSGIRIVADMQTPSQTIPLQVSSPEPEDEQLQSEPGSSLQKIIRFDLKEEGNHVLAVNVTYTETTQDEGGTQATSGRMRSFRKLYQFLAQPCLSVRTKATELPPAQHEDKTLGPNSRSSLLRYVLEAQLENVSEGAIVLGETAVQARQPFKAISLNWDLALTSGAKAENPKLNSRDVLQVAFLIEQQPGVVEGVNDLETSLQRDGRAVLGQLTIEWRSAMGERGYLSTGDLLTRKK